MENQIICDLCHNPCLTLDSLFITLKNGKITHFNHDTPPVLSDLEKAMLGDGDHAICAYRLGCKALQVRKLSIEKMKHSAVHFQINQTKHGSFLIVETRQYFPHLGLKDSRWIRAIVYSREAARADLETILNDLDKIGLLIDRDIEDDCALVTLPKNEHGVYQGENPRRWITHYGLHQ